MVSCLEWLTSSFLFIIVEFKQLLAIPDLKWYSFFLSRKSFKRVQCSNGSVALWHEILFQAMVDDKVMWWPECVKPTLPLKKKSPLGSYLHLYLYSRKLPSRDMNKFPFCHHCPFPILGKPFRTVNVIPVIVNTVVRALFINLMAIRTGPVHRLLFATHTGFWLHWLVLSTDHTD